MNDNRYTKEGLVIVSSEVIKDFVDETTREGKILGYDENLDTIIEQIRASGNGKLCDYMIDTAITVTSSPITPNNVLLAMASVYRMMESQLLRNRLEDNVARKRLNL
jgi:hypothetical protein